MRVGVQWIGSLNAGQARRWFTFNWPESWQVVWTIVPTSPRPGAPQVEWDVAPERASAGMITYWITVRNLTSAPLTFEGRYAVLN